MDNTIKLKKMCVTDKTTGQILMKLLKHFLYVHLCEHIIEIRISSMDQLKGRKRLGKYKF